MLLSTPSAEQESSPQARLQTNSTSLPEISPWILKCNHQASHGPLAAERSFLGRLMTGLSLWPPGGEEPFKLGGCHPVQGTHGSRQSSLIISHEDNLSWETNQLTTAICVTGFQEVCHPANMWALRSMFSWLQTWKPTLCWQLTGSPRIRGKHAARSTPCPFPPAREAPVPTQTGSCCIEGDCPRLTHTRRSNRKHSFFSEPVAGLLLLHLWAFDKNEKRSKTNLCFPFLSTASTVGNNGSPSCLAY